MDHPVVVAAAERAAAAGLVALRFEFRGVRRSGGSRTDKEGHLEDARVACREAHARVPGRRLLGGGFSYGARAFVALAQPTAERSPPLAGLLLLAPASRVPQSPRDFGALLLGRPIVDARSDPAILARLRAVPVPVRVLVGERDVVAPPEELAANLPPAGRLEVLPGVNHFFSREPGAGPAALDLLAPALDRALADLLA
jgi:alpha/beta superfamily hydrolase